MSLSFALIGFALTAAGPRVPGKGALLLLWKAWRFRDGGPPPPQISPDGKPYVDPNARKAAGVVRVDLATGKAAAVAGYQPRDAEFPETEPSWVGPTKLSGWVL